MRWRSSDSLAGDLAHADRTVALNGCSMSEEEFIQFAMGTAGGPMLHPEL